MGSRLLVSHGATRRASPSRAGLRPVDWWHVDVARRGERQHQLEGSESKTAARTDGKIQAVYNDRPAPTVGYSSIRNDDGNWHHVMVTFRRHRFYPGSGGWDGAVGHRRSTLPATAPAYAFGFDEAVGHYGGQQRHRGGTADGVITGATRTLSGRFGGALNFSSASTYVQANDRRSRIADDGRSVGQADSELDRLCRG